MVKAQDTLDKSQAESKDLLEKLRQVETDLAACKAKQIAPVSPVAPTSVQNVIDILEAAQQSGDVSNITSGIELLQRL